MIADVDFALISAGAHPWFIFSLMSTRTPRHG